MGGPLSLSTRSTHSMAIFTPAQKPRGFASRIFIPITNSVEAHCHSSGRRSILPNLCHKTHPGDHAFAWRVRHESEQRPSGHDPDSQHFVLAGGPPGLEPVAGFAGH